MSEFQWIVNDFLLTHLRGGLTALGIVLLAVIVLTAVFVAVELRRDGEDDHADQ